MKAIYNELSTISYAPKYSENIIVQINIKNYRDHDFSSIEPVINRYCIICKKCLLVSLRINAKATFI